MRRFYAVLLIMLSAGLSFNEPASARGGGHFRGYRGSWGGHHHHGAWGYGPIIGFGLGYGLGYGAGYYGGFYPGWNRYGGYYGYPPAVVSVPVNPPVYVQQPRPAVQPYPSGYWYYCTNPEGYYPYVKECLTTWQPVEPKPSPVR